MAAAGEKTGDFANADKPMPRVRGAGNGGAFPEDELHEAPVGRTTVNRTLDDDIDEIQ